MRVIFLVVVITGQVSCSQISNDTTSTISIKFSDKVLTLQKDGESKYYNVDDELTPDISDFVKTINELDYKLEYFKESKIDVTGTGTESICTTSITRFQDGFLVANTIKHHNKEIWKDTLLINDRVNHYWNDSLFYTLKPYSQFYITHKYFKEFIEKPFDPSTEEYKVAKHIFYGLNDIGSDSAYWDKYLIDFKGRLIRKLSIESPGLHIWDSGDNRFINFYEP